MKGWYDWISFVSCQIREADTEEGLQATFHIDEAADLLFATGYRKAITKITVADKSSIRSALLDYHQFCCWSARLKLTASLLKMVCCKTH